MQLTSLTLTNFKNIPEAALTFTAKINCLLGNNGMGKSNLLDAIHYLSLCRSFTAAPDSLAITQGQPFTMIQGQYIRASRPETLQLSITPGRRKVLRRSGKEYPRLSQHIGTFPIVMASPHDIDLIRGSGEERRRWVDIVISQTNPPYLQALQRYNSALEQRNRLLRAGIVDHLLYQAIEQQLALAATQIHSARSEWTAQLTPLFNHYYSLVADTAEQIDLSYTSHLNTNPDLLAHLDNARRHDEAVRHTTVGPHRDDIEFTILGMPLRRSGSQGQCKTFTIALRLAQYHFLHQATGIRPLLLLDDIFDRLDSQRVSRIIELVTTHDEFGQIFITDTNRTNLDHIISRAPQQHSLWHVDHGTFTPL